MKLDLDDRDLQQLLEWMEATCDLENEGDKQAFHSVHLILRVLFGVEIIDQEESRWFFGV